MTRARVLQGHAATDVDSSVASYGARMARWIHRCHSAAGRHKTRETVIALAVSERVSAPVAPTASAGTNMPVDAPTPFVHIMSA